MGQSDLESLDLLIPGQYIHMCVPQTVLSVIQWLYQRADSSLPTHIAREKQLGCFPCGRLWQPLYGLVMAPPRLKKLGRSHASSGYRRCKTLKDGVGRCFPYVNRCCSLRSFHCVGEVIQLAGGFLCLSSLFMVCGCREAAAKLKIVRNVNSHKKFPGRTLPRTRFFCFCSAEDEPRSLCVLDTLAGLQSSERKEPLLRKCLHETQI